MIDTQRIEVAGQFFVLIEESEYERLRTCRRNGECEGRQTARLA